MTSLGKIYSDKETRGGIVVNKGYQVPVDRLIELLKEADHMVVAKGHVAEETEEFLRLPVADLNEVLAILEKL